MGRSSSGGPDGYAVIDKEAGWTSHDVVARARKLLGTRKIGHAGTLDPDATGVLVLGIGRATRLLRFVTDSRKSYTGEVVLGVETSTLDAGGEVTATHSMAAATPESVSAAAATLTGDILQVPPMVSALKVDGKRLHELAREGKEVERAPRPVTVFRFDTEVVAPDIVRVEVDCSSGTYIRTLAADLGHLLGGGAHLRALRRTAVGPFGLDEAVPIEEVVLGPLSGMVRGLPSLAVDADDARAVSHGKSLPDDLGPDGPRVILDGEGTVLAIYEREVGRLRPSVVLAAS